jgi:uracil-DNA glycosylase family 4
MTEDDYAVTNPVLCRPVTDEGKNGKPTDEEMAACARRLAEFLYIVNPMAVVLLGDYARRAWFGLKVPWFKTHIVKGGLPVVGVAYHPSYLLRQGAPEKKTKDYKKQVAYIKGIWGRVKAKRKRPTFKWDEQFHPLIEAACERSKWKNE